MGFFLRSGRLTYSRASDAPKTLAGNHWISEAVLWTTWTHRGTLRAMAETNLLSLDATQMGQIMITFPTRHSSEYAKSFVEDLNTIEDIKELTDLAQSLDFIRHMVCEVFSDVSSRDATSWRQRLSLSTNTADSMSRLRSLRGNSNQHTGGNSMNSMSWKAPLSLLPKTS